MEKSDIIPHYDIHKGTTIRTNMNMNIDLGDGLALTLYERNDPQPVVYVDHKPIIIDEEKEKEKEENKRHSKRPNNRIETTGQNKHNNNTHHVLTPAAAPRTTRTNRTTRTLMTPVGPPTATTVALQPLRKIASVIQKIRYGGGFCFFAFLLFCFFALSV